MQPATTPTSQPWPVADGWRGAMRTALYGPSGFFTRPGASHHFRTSANDAPQFARAVLRLLERIDQALDRPDPLDLVDLGAGDGGLLQRIARAAPDWLAARLRLHAVELAPRPDSLAAEISWCAHLPDQHSRTGLVLATEWLDNIPLDIAEADADGALRYLHVDLASGAESLGPRLSGPDIRWADRWWSGPWSEGERVELGLPRDRAWAQAVGALRRGAALAVDYGHHAPDRPRLGTLTGFRAGRQVPPVPDGSCDITAHVSLDSAADAGAATGGRPPLVVSQRTALRSLGVDGRRPPLALADRDPLGYALALAGATTAAELTEPAGLGGHQWLLQPVGIDEDAFPPGLRCIACAP